MFIENLAVFFIDVPMNAVQTGATAAACSAISQAISDLPRFQDSEDQNWNWNLEIVDKLVDCWQGWSVNQEKIKLVD